MGPGGSMLHSQELSNQSRSEALFYVSEQRWFLQCEIVSLTPNPQAGGYICNLYLKKHRINNILIKSIVYLYTTQLHVLWMPWFS